MRRLGSNAKIIAVLAVAIFGFFLVWTGIQNFDIAHAFGPYNAVLGQLARAESAQTPDEVIHHATIAKMQLPASGPVSWWSPEKGDFKSVQAELDGIISRATSISSLEPENDRFNSEMYDVHARLGAIQEILS